MTSEFSKLTPEEQSYLAKAIARSQQKEDRAEVILPDGSEAYSYPHVRGSAWGLNSGVTGYCIARGIWPEEGSHE